VDFKEKDEEEEDELDIEEERPKAYSGRRSKTNTKALKTQHLKSSRPIKQEDPEDNPVKTVKFKGALPVDERFIEIFGAEYTVYREAGLVYDCMLNQTNLQYNNNKFYLIQVLQSVRDNSFVVWMRWGRVGQSGQTTSFKCGPDLDEAKEIFRNKFWDKTRNEFGSGEAFQKYPGKYDNVEKDYSSVAEEASDTEAEQKEKIEKEVVPSRLAKPVQELIEMICNVTEMENLLKEMKFDTKKAPLGKLSQKQINAGYAALKQIEDHLNRSDFGRTFVQVNNDFYTRIPHDFGMKVPPLIRSAAMMREKMKLLEVLGEIEVAVSAMKQESVIVNELDRHYEQFGCGIEPVDRGEQIVGVIEEYLHKNHAPTHGNYTLKLLDVFELKKENEVVSDDFK